MQAVDTITAIATPPGRGGVGIVRVSGPLAFEIGHSITGLRPDPKKVYVTSYKNDSGEVIDEGLLLYFKGPNSFTGEDVIELQGHGGPVVLDQVVSRVVDLGARLARPGEFSERAFLNDKIDLVQAEAIADLIDAESTQAARSAMRSLEGVFSKQIHALVDAIIKVRMYVEAAIDFPEEEIDFLADSAILEDSRKINDDLRAILKTAEQGVLLQNGVSVVIAGPPNAGKSSLLNALSGRDSAIVTDIAGTTRDVLREEIQLSGVPLHIVDTAGLRDSVDVVEREGMKRAHVELAKADLILLVFDASVADQSSVADLVDSVFETAPDAPIIIVKNKIDLLGGTASVSFEEGVDVVRLSLHQSDGFELLSDALLKKVGFYQHTENDFSARRRHLSALQQAAGYIENGIQQLEKHNAGELLAEDFRQAQNCLSEITGEFTSDDLLGEIFSSFCIGK